MMARVEILRAAMHRYLKLDHRIRTALDLAPGLSGGMAVAEFVSNLTEKITIRCMQNRNSEPLCTLGRRR